jgi:carboxypeptidase D
MFDNPEFEDGISNGSAWFSITGGMQDWSYRYAGVPEVTIELSNIKRPSSDVLDELWIDNEESMLAFIEAARIGLRGVVTDRATGEPVWAKVLITGNEQPVFTDPDVGDYHRLLLPGEYGVTIHAPGLISRREIVQVGEGAATRLDTALSDGDINGDGFVDATDIQLLINAILTIGALEGGDVDGGGLSSTDLQAVVNQALSVPPNRR